MHTMNTKYAPIAIQMMAPVGSGSVIAAPPGRTDDVNER